MSEARARPKEFTFKTSLEWPGDGPGTLKSEGKPDIEFAAPPEFKGPGGLWSPEDLQVAAVESCILLTFLYYVGRADVELREYSSTAEGTVEMGGEGMSFTGFTVRPRIVVASDDQVEAAEEAVRKAEAACLVSRSLADDVEVSLEAEVTSAG